MANAKPIRLATVNATGHRYIVIALDLERDRVQCWGEVESLTARGGAVTTRHDGTRSFARSDVSLSNATKTPELMLELHEQARNGLRARGYHVTGGRIATVYPPTV